MNTPVKAPLKFVTIDFETYYGNGYSLSSSTTEEYIRDSRFQAIGVSIKEGDAPAQWFTGNDIKPALLAAITPNTYLIAHNMMFDGAVLAYRYGITPKVYGCTLDMSRGLGLHHVAGGLGLEALSDWARPQIPTMPRKSTEVLLARDKRVEDMTPGFLADYGAYCKRDTEAAWLLFHYFLSLGFPNSELHIIDETKRLFIEPILRLDKQTLKGHLNTVLERKETLLERCGVTLEQVRSDATFAALLEKMGVEPPLKWSVKQEKAVFAFSKTDEEFLALREHNDLDVQALVECRLGNKSSIEESRTLRFIQIADRGALPFPLKYYGAHTGRFGGADKINVQNLPRGGALRSAIKAPPGHVLVVADSSQIEARVVAWMAGEDDLLSAFAHGQDIYSLFAAEVFGRTVTKADKPERFVGKTSILGLGYGMGAEKFKQTLKRGGGGVKFDMPLHDAKSTVLLYRQKYERIARSWRFAQSALQGLYEGQETTFGAYNTVTFKPGSIPAVVLPNGLSIFYPGLAQHQTEKGPQFSYEVREGRRVYRTKIYGGKVVENIVQALARIIITDQWRAIKKRAIAEGVSQRSPVVGQVHDELLCCVIEPNGERMKQIMVEEMSRAPRWAEGVPVTCEADIAVRYGDAK